MLVISTLLTDFAENQENVGTFYGPWNSRP